MHFFLAAYDNPILTFSKSTIEMLGKSVQYVPKSTIETLDKGVK